MTTIQAADIWQQAREAKAALPDIAEISRSRWAVLLQEFARLLSQMGHQVDTGQVGVALVGGNYIDDTVLTYQGAHWRIYGFAGNYTLMALRPEWQMWRMVRTLADLAE